MGWQEAAVAAVVAAAVVALYRRLRSIFAPASRVGAACGGCGDGDGACATGGSAPPDEPRRGGHG